MKLLLISFGLVLALPARADFPPGEHWADAVAVGGAHNDPRSECIKVRCGLDIGSSGIRVQIARVDVCYQRVLQVLFPTSSKDVSKFAVGFKESMKARPDRTIGEDVQTKAIGILRELQARAKAYGADGCHGAATSVFRDSRNGMAVAERLAKESGAIIKPIPQSKEADLGVFGVLADRPRAVVKSFESDGRDDN